MDEHADDIYWFDEEYQDRRATLQLRVDVSTLQLYWKTQINEKIFIEDMETSHIINILRADLDERIKCDKPTQARFLLELSIRKRTEK